MPYVNLQHSDVPSHDLINISNHCKQIISPQSEMGPTTESDQLKQAQLCIPALVPLLHSRNSFQLGLWLAELIIHHF